MPQIWLHELATPSAVLQAKGADSELYRLSAGDAHMAGDGGTLVPPVDDKVMALGLAGNRGVDGGKQRIIGFRGAQRFAQIGRVVLAKTHVQRAGAGHPHAVAGFAEIMGEGSDEAERTD